jgi:hypothetical protein
MKHISISPNEYDLLEKRYWNNTAIAEYEFYIEALMLVAEGD